MDRTLADLTMAIAQGVESVNQGNGGSGTTSSLTDEEGITEPNGYWNGGVLWFLTGALAGKMIAVKSQVSNTLNFLTVQPAPPCTQQVVGALVGGAVTLAGNASVVVTAAAWAIGSKTLAVPVLLGDSAAVVAGKVRTALAADADVTAFFNVGGTGSTVSLTAKRAAATDNTMGVSVDNGTCTGLTPSTPSLSPGSGCVYVLGSSDYPLNQLVSAINQALSDKHVTTDNATLIGDGKALLFTLPAGVSDVEEVKIEYVGAPQLYPSAHWQELNGQLRFDNNYAPASGVKLHLYHQTAHAVMVNAADKLDDEISLKWLIQEAIFNLLLWGRQQYQDDPDYDIDTRLQVVNEKRKTLAPYKRTVIRVESAGAPD